MKLLIILSVVACSYAAKLDRTYLPPASAATAGGSPGSLTAPGNGPSGVTSGSLAYTGSPSGNIGPGQSSFGKYSAPTLGQQSVSSFGQPDISITNQPTGQELNQPSAFGFQTSSSQYKRPEGETGFGKPNTDGSTFAKTPAGFNQTPNSFGQSPQEQPDFQRYEPERARASIDKNAEILRYDNQNDGETFAYSFETSNGISAEESGIASNGVRAQGSFAYTDDDGQVIRVTYTADENGYQPQGDHLPTPPPIPEEILRSIEQNARAAAAGTQEGAYNPDENVYTPQQFNGVTSTYQDQGRVVSQNTYPQSQGQSSTSQFGSPSFIGSDISRKTPLSGSPNFQGPNKPGQLAPGFSQNGGRLTQSGYQYSQPQATAQFGRPSASSSQTAGQYRPESAPSGQPQGSLLGSSLRVTDKGFAPSGSNGQASVRPSAGISPSAKPKASITEPISTVNGFGQISAFGQSPSAPATKVSGQYQPSQSDSGSSMPAQSSPYQYNRPGQKTATSQQTATQPSFSSTDEQSSSTQNFGAPRQPPSFTDEEGYKY